jgi:tRNA(fMet)-specific endonuclease VapC
MLDTNIASYIVRGLGKPRLVAQMRLGQWGISAISEGELATWLFKTQNPDVEELLTRFLAEVEVVCFGREAAMQFGKIMADSMRRGLPMQVADAQIAAHALVENAVLVTNNIKHFAHIENLALENWVE